MGVPFAPSHQIAKFFDCPAMAFDHVDQNQRCVPRQQLAPRPAVLPTPIAEGRAGAFALRCRILAEADSMRPPTNDNGTHLGMYRKL